MFGPDEGHILIGADYSAQEPRVLAELSRDPILVETFNEGRDIYSVLISLATGRPYDTCTKDYHAKEMEDYLAKEVPLQEAIKTATDTELPALIRELDELRRNKPINYRDRGKLLLLSVMYGLGADSLSHTLGITVDEATDLLERLHEELKGVKTFEAKLKEHVRKTGYLTMIGGRKRRFPNYALPELTIKSKDGSPIMESTKRMIHAELKHVWRYNERRLKVRELEERTGLKIYDNREKRSEDETRILNSIIQGSSARMTKLALVLLRNHPRLREINGDRIGGGILLQVHDEIIIQVPIEHKEEGKQIIEECMEKAAKMCVKSVEFKLEAEEMTHWVSD